MDLDKVEFVPIGDATSGPVLALTALPPGKVQPPSIAHAHASDNFRLSILGDFEMGREHYGPGEFRFQQGWRPYPSDNNSQGPEGGWQIVMFGDRRGARMRPVQIDDPSIEALVKSAHRVLAGAYGLTGDVISDDPHDTAGPSALISTLGPTSNSGKLNGSFEDSDRWLDVAPGTRASVTLLGHRERGPVVVLVASEPGAIAMGRYCVGTEAFHMIVSGSCQIGKGRYETGDMRVQHAGRWCDRIVAGGEGLWELVVLGDRRYTQPATESEPWSTTLFSLIADLQNELG